MVDEPARSSLVSIVMPAYNCARYVEESVNSVRAQSHQNWELIIVEDRSTDDTPKILERIAAHGDSRIRILHNEENIGAARTRNRAIREARGRWIAFLDSDDVWLPDKLTQQIAFMEANGVHFSYTDYEHIDQSGQLSKVRVTGPNIITERWFMRYCWVGCLTVMYDASFVGLIQIPPLKNREDYAMWLKVVKTAECYRLDKVLGLYRRGHGESLSSGGFASLVKYHYRMFRISEGQTPSRALYSTFRNLVFGAFKKVFFVRRYR